MKAPTSVEKNISVVAGLMLLGTTMIQAVYAGETIHFDIPRQNAGEALPAFGQQADVSVIYQFETVKFHQTNRLIGNYSIPDAITVLLENTGLNAQFKGSEPLIITITSDQERKSMRSNKSNLQKTTLLSSVITAMFGAGAGDAVAQDAQNETEQNWQVLEEIVVSASRREENLQEAPAVISVMNESMIESMRIDNMDSLTGSVPGLLLQVNHRDQNRIGMRGAFSSADTPSSGQAVGLYVDNVYYGRSASLGPVLFDMERIEILRGPQGTLYGPNVVGGLINIQTRDPSLTEVEAKLSGTFGEFGLREFGGRISFPLIEDELAVSLSAIKTDSDGWLENLVTGNKLGQLDTAGLRLKSLWMPNDKTRVEAFVESFTDETYGETRHLLPLDGPPDRFTVPSSFEQTLIAEDGYYDRDVFTLGFSVDYDLSDYVTFTSITSYHEADSLAANLPFLAGPVEAISVTRDSDVETFTQEFRFFGEAGDLRWQTGIYYYDDSSSTPETFVSIQDPDTPIVAFGYPTSFTSTHFMENDTESYSIFAQGTYALTDSINLTAGARYVDESKDSFVLTSGDAFPGNYVIEEIFTVSQSASWSEFTPKLGIDLIQEDVGSFDSVFYYATVTKGFKSGDFVKQTTLVNSIGTTEPEFVWNYEAGIKTTFWDYRANFNVTLFDTDYEDLQSQVLDSNGFVVIVNNDASAKGVEATFSVMPTDNLSLSASYSYLDTEISSDDPAFDGKRLPAAPENSYSLQAIYEWSVNDYDFALTANYSYQDPTFIDVENVEPPVIHDMTEQSRLNMDLLISFGNWELSFWGKNLLDEEMLLEVNDLGGIWSYSQDESFVQGKEQFWNGKFDMPRTMGATATWQY